jgi:hypothetical protein
MTNAKGSTSVLNLLCEATVLAARLDKAQIKVQKLACTLADIKKQEEILSDLKRDYSEWYLDDNFDSWLKERVQAVVSLSDDCREILIGLSRNSKLPAKTFLFSKINLERLESCKACLRFCKKTLHDRPLLVGFVAPCLNCNCTCSQIGP